MNRKIILISMIFMFICSYGTEVDKDNYQIPSDKLSQMNTSTVLDLCLDYPDILDVTLFDDLNKGFNRVSNRFNGFKELFNRKDLFNAVLEKYSELPSKTKAMSESTLMEKGKLSTSYMALELITSQDFFYGSLDKEGQDKLISSLRNSLSEMKNNPEIFGGVHNIIISSIIGKLTPDKALYYTVDTVHTPNQTPVTVNTFNIELSESEIIYKDSFFCAKYGATLIGSSTMKYNCHSYAWYMRGDTTKTRYWMDNPFNYIDDWSYEVTDSTQAEIVCYETATGFIEHSARRIGTGVYESKWGDGPLVIHTLTGTPYNYNDYGVKQHVYYKRASPYISGAVIPCGGSVYSLEKIPSSFTVNWSFVGTIPSGKLIPNSPTNTQCTINNNNSSYIKGNLIASVYNSGFHVKSLTKGINTGYGFSASYIGTPIPLLYTGPVVSGTVQSGDEIVVNRAYSFSLTSSYFTSYTVMYSGSAVQNWVNSGSGTITFDAVNSNPGTTSIITIDGISNCHHFRFVIKVMCRPQYYLTESSLDIQQMGRSCNIILTPEYEIDDSYNQETAQVVDKDLEWDLKVVNTLTGEIVFNCHVVGESVSIDTSKWPAGVYVVYAQMGDQTVSKKIVVK